MRLTPERALVYVTCAALLGVFVGATPVARSNSVAWVALGALTAACLGLGAALVRPGAEPPRWQGAVLVLAAFASGVALAPRDGGVPTLPPAGLVRVQAVVRDVRFGQGTQARSLIEVQHGVRTADDAPIASGTRLWVQPFALPEGASVQLVGTLSPTVPLRNPTPHPPLPSAHAPRGYVTLPSPDAVRIVSHGHAASALDTLRSHVRERMNTALNPQAAAVARALVLGDPDTLDDSDTESVRASGMAHVLAVSGMHVTLLAGVVLLALRGVLLRTPMGASHDVRRLAAAGGVPMALFIGAFTGAVPSGIRAAVTAALAWALIACGRRPSAGALTAATCLLMLWVEPEHALRPAFLLSIAATAAIVAAPSPPARTLTDWVRAAVVLSTRTTLATAPLVLWTFGTFPVLGILANLALLPLGSALLVLCAAHAILVSLAPPLGWPLAWLVSTCCRAFLAACQVFADLSPGIIWPPLDVWQGLVGTLAIVVLLFATNWRTRALASVLALPAMSLLEVRLRWVEQPRDEVRVTFVDVGQGDAALVDLPDGRLMLIDAGGSLHGGADPGERALVPLLRARRRKHIDVAVVSHPHPDHYGGLGAVLDAVSIGEVWDSGQAHAERDMEASAADAARWIEKAQARGARIHDPATLCGSPRTFGSAVVEVLWPCPRHDPDRDPNDNSLVVRITYGQHRFLFTGDIEAHAETALTASGVSLRADVLKVPHHGSRTSSSDALLRAVSPSLAVVSAGAVNRFGHPHAEVLQRLRARIPHVVDLGSSGGTIVTTDGDTLHYRTWAGPHAELPRRRICTPTQNTPETTARAVSVESSTSAVNGVAKNE
jgi:competence protein ComEC